MAYQDEVHTIPPPAPVTSLSPASSAPQAISPRKAVRSLTKRVNREAYGRLVRQYGYEVRYGPFSTVGFKYQIESHTWGNSVLKWLGMYESCLHPSISTLRDRHFHGTVIDVGCAEGYYAAALGRFLGARRVIARDINETSIRICSELVKINCPGTEFQGGGRLEAGELNRLIADDRTVVFMDCEGDEVNLLQLDAAPNLRNAEIIVECHERDPACRDIVDRVQRDFSASHHVQIVGERDIAASDYEEIRQLPGVTRSLLTCETRRYFMRWMHLLPRSFEPRRERVAS